MGGRRDFEQWVHRNTNTTKRKHYVYDIEIVFPKIQRGHTECIMLFDKMEDTKYVIDKIQDKHFRGFPLHFQNWCHPNYVERKKETKQNKINKTNKMNMNMIALNKNKIISSSKPQSSIWAKMASQRKQKKMQQETPQTDNMENDKNNKPQNKEKEKEEISEKVLLDKPSSSKSDAIL